MSFRFQWHLLGLAHYSILVLLHFLMDLANIVDLLEHLVDFGHLVWAHLAALTFSAVGEDHPLIVLSTFLHTAKVKIYLLWDY